MPDAATANPDGRPPRVWIALLALATALGLLLRFLWLDAALLWHDEVATRIFAAGYTPDDWRDALYTGRVFPVAEVQRYQAHVAGNSVLETVAGLATDDPQHPPLYYVLARAWVGRFGDGVWALRSLSAIVSLGMLPALFWSARELFGSRRVAWTAVALVAASPFFVLYAQEAREYALWAVLVALCGAALLRAMRLTEAAAPGRHAAWAIYGSLVLVALYTSFTTVGMALAHVLFIVIDQRGRFTRVSLTSAATLAGSALLFSPWALALAAHFEAFQASMRWSKEIVIPISSLLRILAFNISRVFLDFWPELDNPAAWATTALALALVGWGLAELIRREPSRAALLLLLLILVPIGLMLIPDLLFGGIRSVSARYMTPSWIALVLVLAAALAPRGPQDRVRTGLLGVVLAFGIASCWSNAGQDAVWTKGTSAGLPQVAEIVNAAPSPLVIGDNELHHPGNLMALANLLGPTARMQFLTIEMGEAYVLPPHSGAVFLFSPIPPFRDHLARQGAPSRLVYEDLYVQLWEVERTDDN